MKGKELDKYKSMSVDQLKQELYKLRYELATSDKKRDIRHFSRAYNEIKRQISLKMVDIELARLEEQDTTESKTEGRSK